MKHRNKVKRLQMKQREYDNMIAKKAELAHSYYRPGSVKKS